MSLSIFMPRGCQNAQTLYASKSDQMLTVAEWLDASVTRFVLDVQQVVA
jgi:hypothetical protein